jgi:hypothetical protein
VRGEQSLRPSRAAAVEGILIPRLVPSFAGFHQIEDLGRSVSSTEVSTSLGRTRRRQQMPFGYRGGARRRLAPQSTSNLVGRGQQLFSTKDTSFTQSIGPCSSFVVKTPPAQADGGRGTQGIGVVQARIAGGIGNGALRVGRSAARRASPLPQGRKRDAYGKEKGCGLFPSEDREFRTKCPHVVNVAEVVRHSRISNTLPRSAPKRVAAGVNGDLARREFRRESVDLRFE